MTRPSLAGIYAVKLPVSDLTHSRQWYADVFGLRATVEFPDDDGVIRGVACTAEGLDETLVALRESVDAAAGLRGFNPVLWGVPDRDALAEWGDHLDTVGITHSPIIDATIGWLMVLHDPDGLEHHLYTRTRHGIDQSDRRGYGRMSDVPQGGQALGT
jgi:catechol 2,3-dioxygenase-like lactoylglutathione lyase family enzyme